jgi:hypothetical protein
MASLQSLAFSDAAIESLPVEKQPYGVLSWLSQLVKQLRLTALTSADRQFVVNELSGLLEFIDKGKDNKSALTSKPIRLELAKAFQLAYAGSHSATSIYETANKLNNFLNTGKTDKYTEMKQYVCLHLVILANAVLPLCRWGPCMKRLETM